MTYDSNIIKKYPSRQHSRFYKNHFVIFVIPALNFADNP